ncbi:hypothetical protein OC834_007311 [Tilletia horrida]|nr:hypothetical protein OC834_007311 [Tilletia horrida]
MPPKVEEALERTTALAGRIDSLEQALAAQSTSLDALRDGNNATSAKLDALLARLDSIPTSRNSSDSVTPTVTSSSATRPRASTGTTVAYDSAAAAARGAPSDGSISMPPGDGAATAASESSNGRFRFNLKPEELSRFDGRPEESELWLADIEAMLDSELDPAARSAWEAAIVRVLPRTLRGAARLWYAALDSTTRQKMATLQGEDGWFDKIRASFSPSPAIIRQQARQRVWNPDTESALHYSFAKVALLKAAWKSLSDNDTITDIVDGLPLEIRAVLRVPLLRKPKLDELRDELRTQEAYWRERHNRPLTIHSEGGTASSSAPATSSFGSLLQPTQSQDTLSGPSAFPQQPSPTPRPTSAGSSRPGPFLRTRRGKSIREDFDPARLFHGPHPATGKRTMAYKVPGTNETMWCNRPCRTCKGDHFDFAHDHCSHHAVHTADADEDYPVTVDDGTNDSPGF